MRILHSSDWHLGISLGRRRLLDLQESMLLDLLTLIDRERVDVLVIAGDIYDQSVPPLEAIDLFDRFVAKLCLERGIPVVAIAGNHDSPERLSQYAALLNRAGLFISGRIAERRVIRIGDVCFHLFPYFHAAEVRRLFPEEKIDGTEEAMQVLVRASLADYAERQEYWQPIKKRQVDTNALSADPFASTECHAGWPGPSRHIAIAHCFTLNAEPSGTDRMALLSMGGSSLISASVFKGYDRVFLGHLHRRQSPLPQVSYSGSPAVYAFSEIGQPKGVQIYDTETDHLTFHELNPAVRLVQARGSYADLCAGKGEYSGFEATKFETAEAVTRDLIEADQYLWRLILTDQVATLERLEHLRSIYPNLLVLESEVSRREATGAIERRFDEQTLLTKPEEILSAFYQDSVGVPLTDLQKKAFKRAWEQAEEEV